MGVCESGDCGSGGLVKVVMVAVGVVEVVMVAVVSCLWQSWWSWHWRVAPIPGIASVIMSAVVVVNLAVVTGATAAALAVGLAVAGIMTQWLSVVWPSLQKV